MVGEGSYLETLRQAHTAEAGEVAQKVYDAAPLGYESEEIDSLMHDHLEEIHFKSFFSDATLIEPRQFKALSPEDKLDVDFKRTCEKFDELKRKGGPLAGVDAGIGYFDGHPMVVVYNLWNNTRGAATGEVEGRIIAEAILSSIELDLPISIYHATGGMDQLQAAMAVAQMDVMAYALTRFYEESGQAPPDSPDHQDPPVRRWTALPPRESEPEITANEKEIQTRIKVARKTTGHPMFMRYIGPTFGGDPAALALLGTHNSATSARIGLGFAGERVIRHVVQNVTRDSSGMVTDYDQSAATNLLDGNGVDAIIGFDSLVKDTAHRLDVLGYQKLAQPATRSRRIISRIREGVDEVRHSGTYQHLDRATHDRYIRIGRSTRILEPDEPIFVERPRGIPNLHRDEYPLATVEKPGLPTEPAHPSSFANWEDKNPAEQREALEKYETQLKWHHEHYETNCDLARYEQGLQTSNTGRMDALSFLVYGTDDYVLDQGPLQMDRRLHFGNVITAIATIDDEPFMFIGQQPDYYIATLAGKDVALRAFSQMNPHAWKKASTAFDRADHYGLRVVTYIDSPGADSTRQAERGGQALAMSTTKKKLYGAKKPTQSIVEMWGSGGGGNLAQTLWPQPIPIEGSSIVVADPSAGANILKKGSNPKPTGEAYRAMAAAAGVSTRYWMGPDSIFDADPIPYETDARVTALNTRPRIANFLRATDNLDFRELRRLQDERYRRLGKNVRLVYADSSPFAGSSPLE